MRETPSTSTSDHAQRSGNDPFAGDGRGQLSRELERLLLPICQSLGFDLVAVLVTGGAGRRLEIYLDHPNGVTLDDCVRMTPVLGTVLDAESREDDDSDGEAPAVVPTVELPGILQTFLSRAYTLEVSSPGLERPLRRRSHFARFAGRTAKIRTYDPLSPESARRSFQGEIVGVEPALDDDETNRVTERMPASQMAAQAASTPAGPSESSSSDDWSGVVLIRDSDGDTVHRIPLLAISRANLVDLG